MSLPAQTQVAAKKPKPAGILSLFIFLVIKLMLCTLLAWIILTVWFASEIVLKDKETVIHDMHSIIDRNINFITSSKSYSAKNLMKSYEDNRNTLYSIITGSNITEYINSILLFALNTTEIIFLRLVIFILMLPIILVVMFVCAIDGLVKRDIRKFQGARESTLLFHKTKALMPKGFYLSIFIYLCIPLSMSPLFFIGLLAILVGISMSVTITYFKKYV